MSAAGDGIKILMVITTLDTGGAEKHLLLLCEKLRQKGHHPEIVYLKGRGSLAPEFQRIGVAAEKIAFESPLHLIRAVRSLAAKIREGAYDLIHSHLLKADFIAALASRAAGHRALIASKHNDEQILKNPIVGFVHQLISRRAVKVIVLSDHVKDYMERYGRVDREKMVRIYYGLDESAFQAGKGDQERVRQELGAPSGTAVLIMVARFAPQKDHACLLRAARLLKDEGYDFRLLLVGGDPFGAHEQEMKTLSGSLGLQDCVTFLGIRRDVPALLSVSDIFVMPSLWEGLGLVFLEAMAFALPVVANRVSAIPEIVRHEETGFLVRPGQPEALKEALARLLNDPEEAKAFGNAGRERLKTTFSLEKMVEKTVQVYTEHLEPD